MYARQRVQPTGTNRPRAWIDNDVRARYGVLSRARAPGVCLPRSSLTTDFGGHSGGVTPVPIPNTEVKPTSADGTWEETPWESRSPPDFSDRTGPFGAPFFVFISVHLVRYDPAHGLLPTPSLVPPFGCFRSGVGLVISIGLVAVESSVESSLGLLASLFVPSGWQRVGGRSAIGRTAVRLAPGGGPPLGFRRVASPMARCWPVIPSGVAWLDAVRVGSRRAAPVHRRRGET